MVSIEKDKKGGAFVVSHLRGGYHEQIWLSGEELKQLHEALHEMEKDG